MINIILLLGSITSFMTCDHFMRKLACCLTMKKNIKKVWRPSPDFVFPATILNQKKRKLSVAKKHSWLVYSKILDGAFVVRVYYSEAKVLPMAINLTG